MRLTRHDSVVPPPSVMLAIAIRPWLWQSAYRFKPDKGFFPPREYMEFRMQTMYADKHHVASAKDMVTFLNWCRRAHAARLGKDYDPAQDVSSEGIRIKKWPKGGSVG